LKILSRAEVTERDIKINGKEYNFVRETEGAYDQPSYWGDKATGKFCVFITAAGFLYFGRFEGFLDMTDTKLQG
jgi:hypothetical protein